MNDSDIEFDPEELVEQQRRNAKLATNKEPFDGTKPKLNLRVSIKGQVQD